MKILAFDTSTETLSIAVGDGERTWTHSGAGGAHASSTLIPAILSLMRQAGFGLAELDAIAFGRGPGSFTGLRTACSVAQGLAFGARVKVLPIDTLLVVAEEARHAAATVRRPSWGGSDERGMFRVVAALDARMDEMYVAAYDFSRGAAPDAEPELLNADNLRVPPGWVLAGNVFNAYGARLDAAVGTDVRRIEALPTASAMLRLAPALLAAGSAVNADEALPRYIRDKVAKTTAERAALAIQPTVPTGSGHAP